MEAAAMLKLPITTSSEVQIFTGVLLPQFAIRLNFSRSRSCSNLLPGIRVNNRNPGSLIKGFATRRRRANTQSETYVLMEPGKDEEFMSEDELRERLKEWLENWPGDALPPDLARFDAIDDAVQYLVKSVCELEIDGQETPRVEWLESAKETTNYTSIKRTLSPSLLHHGMIEKLVP